MPWFRKLIAGLSAIRSEFDQRPELVGFVVVPFSSAILNLTASLDKTLLYFYSSIFNESLSFSQWFPKLLTQHPVNTLAWEHPSSLG
jgi:hypothetical protein